MDNIVVVGGSLAGVHAVEAAREAGYQDSLTLVVAESEYCCTTCDGAVFLLDGISGAALVARRAS